MMLALSTPASIPPISAAVAVELLVLGPPTVLAALVSALVSMMMAVVTMLAMFAGALVLLPELAWRSLLLISRL